MKGPNYEISTWSKNNSSFERVKRENLENLSVERESTAFPGLSAAFLAS